tara:strand:+ start:876 stop:1487 length:612 start_codon:yes stop_codon:yes gene_type:complete
LNITKATRKIIKILDKSIYSNKKITMLVSGGESPKNILNKLNQIQIDWNKVEIMLSDERLVEKDHKFSNERNLKENFFRNYAKNSKYKCIRDFDEEFDSIKVALIGFGLDGHFASIFPYYLSDGAFMGLNSSPEIKKTIALGNPTVKRLTTNLKVFSSINNIFLIINSKEKFKILKDAIHNEKLPLHYLLKLDTPRIYFVNDF